MSISNPATAILLADDHQLVVDGIKSMLASETAYRIAGEAVNGRQALDMIRTDPGRFQILIADINMPQLTGIELCRAVKEEYPEVRVLILSMYNSISVVNEAIAAEADGYLIKNTGKAEFLVALDRIRDSGTYFSQDIIPAMCSQYMTIRDMGRQLSELTQREREILILIGKEMTSGEIAAELCISKKTVDTHRAHLLEKTNCRSTIGLLKFAIRAGIIEA